MPAIDAFSVLPSSPLLRRLNAPEIPVARVFPKFVAAGVQSPIFFVASDSTGVRAEVIGLPKFV
jgi:hypothetical protein